MRRTTLITTIILFLLIISPVTVLASTSDKSTVNFTYTVFNSADWTDKELEKEFTSYRVDVYVEVTFNSTTSNPRLDICIPENKSAPQNAIIIFLYANGGLDVCYNDGSNDYKISKDGAIWADNPDGSEVYAVFCDDEINVYAYNGSGYEQVVKGYATDIWKCGYIRARGNNYYTTAGYVVVEVRDYKMAMVSGLTDLFLEWLPVIIYIGALSALFGMLAKILKKMGA